MTDRGKDDFLAMISHELLNRLTAIHSSTYIMSRAEPGSDRARRAAHTIDRQTELVALLVEDLLDLVRIKHNRLELRLERVDLRDLVACAAEHFRRQMRDHGIMFDVEVADEDTGFTRTRGASRASSATFSTMLRSLREWETR